MRRGGASREARRPSIAPYRNGTRVERGARAQGRKGAGTARTRAMGEPCTAVASRHGRGCEEGWTRGLFGMGEEGDGLEMGGSGEHIEEGRGDEPVAAFFQENEVSSEG